MNWPSDDASATDRQWERNAHHVRHALVRQIGQAQLSLVKRGREDLGKLLVRNDSEVWAAHERGARRVVVQILPLRKMRETNQWQ